MHADTVFTVTCIGTTYVKKGQYDRAMDHFERALRIQTATLGEMQFTNQFGAIWR